MVSMLKVVKANGKPLKQAKINVVFNKQAFINYKPRFIFNYKLGVSGENHC